MKITYTALFYQYLKPDTIVLKILHCHCGLFLELTNIIAIVMRFLVTCLWVWLIILRLPPTYHHDPSMTTVTGKSPDTIRFASHALLDSYGVVVVDWKIINSLRLKTRGVYRVYPQKLYRVHQPVAVIITLLLTSGDVECNPAPVQYPCTVCEKHVKGTSVALCVMAVVNGHMLVVAVWERLNTCC